MGIDPGSAVTGFGVVERDGSVLRHVAHGTLRLPRAVPLAERLGVLLSGLGGALDAHRPDVVVVERVFVARSAGAALVLGQARGVALASAAARALPVHEYSAAQIKQAVVGHGAAAKPQVQAMVKALLGLPRAPASDAADALAAAICHAHIGGRLGALLAAAGGRPAHPRARAGHGGGRGFVLRRAR